MKMIVFSCEFPICNKTGLAGVPDKLKKWVLGSPHYPWVSASELEFPPANGEIFIDRKEGHKVLLATVKDDRLEAVGIKHEWIEEESKEWTTEVVTTHRHDNNETWVSVKLFCDLVRPGGEIPIPKKPYIVRLLSEEHEKGNDGPFTVSNDPIILNDSDIDLALEIIQGTVAAEMPIAYVSMDTSGHTSINTLRLARWLSGIAHVVVEPNRKFSMQLAKVSKGVNCYSGAIGIYWPRGNGEHFRILPRHIRPFPETENYISLKIRKALLNSGTNKGLTWIDLNDILARNRLEQLRSSGSKDLEEYINTFDETNKALIRQLENLNYQNQSLKDSLKRMQAKSGRGTGIFNKGDEPEFYDGECSDLILRALRKYKTLIHSGSRADILITDLLNSNSLTGEQENIKRIIRDVFKKKSKIDKQSIASLESIGFSITDDGKHYKAIFNEDPRFTFSLPKTPSDSRAGMNLEHDITKKILIT